MKEIWKRDGESEEDLDIRYQSDSDDEGHQSPTLPNTAPTGNQRKPEVISSNDSENVPLAKQHAELKSRNVRYTHLKFISQLAIKQQNS